MANPPSSRKLALEAYIERALEMMATPRRKDRRQTPNSDTPPFLTREGIIEIDRRSNIDRRKSRRN